MKKINVKMSEWYCGCCGCSEGWEDTLEIEVSDEFAEVMKSKADAKGKNLDFDDIEEMGRNEVLGKKVREDARMVCKMAIEQAYDWSVEFWLENSSLFENEEWEEWLTKDMESGEYVPEISWEEFLDKRREANDESDEDEDEDEDELRWEYTEAIQDDYEAWVKSFGSHTFVAERVGLDLGAIDVGGIEMEFSSL